MPKKKWPKKWYVYGRHKDNEDKFTMCIYGSIVDKNGKRLFSLDELVEVCLNKWNELSKRYNQ